MNKCDNCECTGEPEIELADIPDLFQRIEPGGVVPSGECPECGALCYPVEESVPQSKAERDHITDGEIATMPDYDC